MAKDDVMQLLRFLHYLVFGGLLISIVMTSMYQRKIEAKKYFGQMKFYFIWTYLKTIYSNLEEVTDVNVRMLLTRGRRTMNLFFACFVLLLVLNFLYSAMLH